MYNADKSGHSKATREKVLDKCWQFLLVNFDKFSDTNKLKVALELSKKTIPSQTNLQADVRVIEMSNIQKGIPGVDTPGNRLLEYNLG
jgi:hypothetical protein